MKTIKITCEACEITYSVERTIDIHPDAVSMGCNWCPECEEFATDYYKEWANYE